MSKNMLHMLIVWKWIAAGHWKWWHSTLMKKNVCIFDARSCSKATEQSNWSNQSPQCGTKLFSTPSWKSWAHSPFSKSFELLQQLNNVVLNDQTLFTYPLLEKKLQLPVFTEQEKLSMITDLRCGPVIWSNIQFVVQEAAVKTSRSILGRS